VAGDRGSDSGYPALESRIRRIIIVREEKR